MDTGTAPGLRHLSIADVTLAAEDVPALTTFYRDLLGFDVLDSSAVRVTLGFGSPLLVIERALLPRSPASTGLFHTAFLVPSRQSLADALLRLHGRGMALEGVADHGVSEALYLSDPEGNGIEIYRDRPSREWPREGGELAMVTEPLDVRTLLEEGRTTEPDPGTRVGHIHLRVGDLAEADRFYREGVGLERMQLWGTRASFLAAGGYHHHIGLNTWSSLGFPRPRAGAAGLAGFTLAVRGRADLDAVASRLDALGAGPTTAGADLRVVEPSGARLRVVASPAA